MENVVTRPAAAPTRKTRRIYVPVALLCLLIAMLGFWSTYFGPLLLTATPHPLPIIHLHAAVFMTWVFLTIAQAWLAANGELALHMKLGRIGFGWGVVVIVVGWVTAFSRFADRVRDNDFQEAQLNLFAPLTDMFVFAPFLAAAWHYRRRPEIHKRLMVVCSTILLVAAVHRMTLPGGEPLPTLQLVAVWLSPILLGMAYDYVKLKTVHVVYLLGIAAVLLMKFPRFWLHETQAWIDFTRWLATFV